MIVPWVTMHQRRAARWLHGSVGSGLENKKGPDSCEIRASRKSGGRCVYTTSSNPGCAQSSYPFVHGWTLVLTNGRFAMAHSPLKAARANATLPMQWVRLVVEGRRVITMKSLMSCK